MLSHELQRVAKCVRGLCHYLPSKNDSYDFDFMVVRHDRDRERDNKKQARAMACASVSREETPIIGVCTNLALLPKPFLAGILLHEMTHLAFNLMGSQEAEVDVDATIMELVPEANYLYEDVTYRDRVSGKSRKARNLQRVEDEFADFCLGWWADKCRDGKVVVK
jgi:hypothetical protein